MEQSKLADYNLWANELVRNLLNELTEGRNSVETYSHLTTASEI